MTRSLKKQLIFWLLALQTLVGLLTAGISFILARNEVNALLDHQLIQIARSVDEGSQLPAMRDRYGHESDSDKAHDFVIQVWMNGLPVRTSRPGFNLPRATQRGFSDQILINATGTEHWRAYTLFYPDRVVQISQAESVRLNIALHSALRSLLPGLALIPLSWLLIGLLVSRLLKPLESITEAAARRELNSLEPLPTENIPIEVAPLINAINQLVSRLSLALSAQRQFLSDAAHELRTPLAALQLQIEGLPQSPSPMELRLRVEEMQRGVLRASRLVSQLLRISRYEAQQRQIERHAIDLNHFIKNLIADFIPLADQKHIDLGLIQDDAATVLSSQDDLHALFGNLLDNAIRYTPVGGTVDIRIRRTQSWV